LPLCRALLWDRDRARAEALAGEIEGLEAEPVDDLARAARRSDIIVTCTTAREPFLGPEMVRPGTFVAAVGADSPDKSEIRPELMAEARVVADVVDQCARMGDLHHALAAGAMRLRDVHAGLAELVAGTRPGRTEESGITLFDSTGTALQDVAAAAILLERVRGRNDFLSVALGAP
jgi:ornithine cyclodeaminase/alanine dehydrogenase-like protein (mu-crystallin family)